MLARSDTFAPLPIPEVETLWLGRRFAAGPRSARSRSTAALYRGALSPAEAGGTVFGFVLAGTPVDDALARALRDASDKRDRHPVADRASPAARCRPSASRGGPPRTWRRSSAAAAPLDVDLERRALPGGARDAARRAAQLRVVSLQSRDRALAPYRSIQIGLLLLGVLAAAAGIAGSAILARSLTAPIGQLVEATRQVAAGTTTCRSRSCAPDEIGDLARVVQPDDGRAARARGHAEVRVAVDGRDDPGEPARRRSDGERRTITLLFCDIRGFTTFAERARRKRPCAC